MPVVRIHPEKLLDRVGLKMPLQELIDVLRALKCDVEIGEDGRLEVEVTSDRPDMLSLEGLAYAIRLYRGIAEPRELELSGTPITVRNELPASRPYIAVALVEGVKIEDEETLSYLIQFQEKLHGSYGRNRRKMAIGLHDADKLPSLDLIYRYVDIDETMMIPLHSSKRMSIRDVLRETEQGRLYGSISIEGSKHPAIISGGEVISLPPVINSDITRIEVGTKNVLVDVTGTNYELVKNALNWIVHALSFYGGRLFGARIIRSDGVEEVTPDYRWRNVSVDINFISAWLGIDVNVIQSSIDKALKRCGLKVSAIDRSKTLVSIPPYRSDILHQVDVAEDVAIGLGYTMITPIEVPTKVPKKPSIVRTLINTARKILIGLGYIEIRSFTLVKQEHNEIICGLHGPTITNPLIEVMESPRTCISVSLLTALASSQHASMPVKIFEVGHVVAPSQSSYTGWRNKLKLGMARMDSVIKFEEIHADVHSMLTVLELEPTYHRCSNHGLFIAGRCAEIHSKGLTIGKLGEVNPEILEKLGISFPVAMAELDIEAIMEIFLR